jgi:hypothetical protein
MAKLVKDNKISKRKFMDSYNAWINHALHGDCKQVVDNLNKRINDIISEDYVRYKS